MVSTHWREQRACHKGRGYQALLRSNPAPPLQSWSVTEPLTNIPAGRMPLPTPRPTSPAPGTCPGTTKVTAGGMWGVGRGGRSRGRGADQSLPLPVQHRLVFKRCGPDGQWVRGPRGQPWRDASQCQMDDEELEVQVSPRWVPQRRGGVWGRAKRPSPAPTGHCRLQKEVAKMYSSFQVMYTVGYSLSLGALLLALATLLGLRYTH